jgi:hypothetical protein
LASVQGIGSVSSVGLLGPLSLTLLFVGVSVDLTETRQLKNKTKRVRVVPAQGSFRHFFVAA